MSVNPFVVADEEYKRDIDPIRDYIEQSSWYLVKMRGIGIDEAREWVREKISGIRAPIVRYTDRSDNGDQEVKRGSIVAYLYESIRDRELIAPSMTTYSSKKESMLSGFIGINTAKRSVAKKAMFAAEARGDKQGEAFEGGKQTNFKLSNNAVSGALVSSSNPLCNPSGHSTLTSNCRMTAALANCNNERLLTGNRHYYSRDVVINNIVSICSNTDYRALEQVMDKYELHYPSSDEVMETIRYSTDLYWSDSRAMDAIRAIVERLEPIEKAAFVYTGDMYHLKVYNEDQVRQFLTRAFEAHEAVVADASAIETIRSNPEDYVLLAHCLKSDAVRGLGKDYKAMGEETLATLQSAVLSIRQVLEDYRDWIEIFFVTDNVPPVASYFPTSMRRCVLTGDTDSTIFTAMSWVGWLNDGIYHGTRADAISAAITFIASQDIIHILARMSANAGVAKKNLRLIAMKNEFYFPVFVPTLVNKHYYASISVQEGNVYAKLKRERKGVHLKNSNIPRHLVVAANELMDSIMDTTLAGGQISLIEVFRKIADIERNMSAGILSGDRSYYRNAVIKTKDSYHASIDQSPYYYWLLWQQVFAPKYGDAGEPPVDTISVSTSIATHTQLLQWLSSMADRQLAKRLQLFLAEHNKKNLKTILVPVSILSVHGMPQELQQVIDARSIVVRLCRIYYLILQTLGVNMMNDRVTTLVSDYY